MEGTPRISDFCHCSITKDTDSVNASTPNNGCTVRYCAPELLDIDGVIRLEKRKPTYKSDVYSLSMVIVEVRLFSEDRSVQVLTISFLARDRKDALPRTYGPKCQKNYLKRQTTTKASPFRSPRDDPGGLEDRRKVLAREREGATGGQCRPPISRRPC